MTKGDQLIERAADRLEEFARASAASDGIRGKLAGELGEDAEFLRKLKPSLIAARARGEQPTNERTPPPKAPAGPQVRAEPVSSAKPKPKRSGGGSGGGPNPFLVIGSALVIGIALAKWLDWRGHAHPRI